MLTDTVRLRLDRLPHDRPFTTATAAAEGVSTRDLTDLVTAGLLRRPVRSVYLPRALPDSLEVRLAALEAVVPPGCFVTDHTAAWLHAGDSALLPNAHVTRSRPDVFRHSGLRALKNPLVRSGERLVVPEHLMAIGNVEVTTPIRTACDLGRLYSRDVALWGLDCMLGLGVFSPLELNAFVRVFARQRGVVQLRWLTPLADGGSQSFGESATRLRWYDAGLPRPRCQVPVLRADRVAYFLDMGDERHRFAAEYDGERWHSSDDQQAHDRARRAELSEGGWWIEVLTRENVFGQQQDAERRLRQAYALHKRANRRSCGGLGPARR